MSSFIKFEHQPLDRDYAVTAPYNQSRKRSSGETYYHSGVDLDVYDSNSATIYAVNSGTVIHAGYSSSYGYLTIIDHGGYHTLYAHMQGNYYKTGDVVKSGDALGLMGNTGHSSGNHLHLELRSGSASTYSEFLSLPKSDPTPFLSGGSYPIEDNARGGSFGQYSNSTDSSGVQTFTGEAIAQLVSSITPQPIHAFIKIFLGDDLVLLSTDPPKPNIFQSFEYTRYQGVGEEATFTLFDTNWDDIELALARNHDRVYIQYGYYGMEGKVNYPIRKHRLSDYSISFVNTGVLLTVSSITEGAYQNLEQTTVVLSESINTQNPTEFVKAVCEQMGWIVEDENFDASEDVDGEPFSIVNDFPVTYIVNNVVPVASGEGEDPFYFYLDADNKAYFKRQSTGSLDKIRTYIYQKGYDSPVIDLTFDIKGIFGGTTAGFTATGLRGSTIDPVAKHQEFYSVDSHSVITVAYGESTNTKSDQSAPTVDTTADTAIRSKRKMNYYLVSSINAQYTATMTIVGDPTIELLENVRIINITDSGNLHHTSGVYWVKGITDSISDGKLLTTLELARNATTGIDGIELINPKFLIK